MQNGPCAARGPGRTWSAHRKPHEVDGDIHGFGDQPRKDAQRGDWLRRCGVETLRIPARDVLYNLDGVHLLLQDRTAARATQLKSLPTG